MIEIKIQEAKFPNNSFLNATPRSGYDKFVEGFKKLCVATGMNEISARKVYSSKIPTILHFDDGTSIGISRLFDEIGFDILNN